MKVYTINKISFKNQSLSEIYKTFQQNLLYFSKNYATILKKTEEFVKETDNFFKNNEAHYNGYHIGDQSQNTTPADTTRRSYFFTSTDLYTIIYVSEVEVPSLSESPLEVGDYVEIVPEAVDNVCGRTGFSKRDYPPIFRVMQIANGNVKVMVICGSVNVSNQTQGMTNQYTYPIEYFRRITKL